jgi:hypothetical protein
MIAGGAVALAAVPVDAAPSVAPTQPSWVANQDDALLFDVHLAQYRLGEGVRGYATPSGTCVDFGDIIMTLDLPVRLDKKSRRATGWIFNEGRTITIDREANTVQIMNIRTKVSATTIQDTPEGWCVLVPALADWLGIKIKEDRSNALLLLQSETKLPIQSALERKAKAASIRPQTTFDLKTLPQARVTYAGIRPPAIDVVASLSAVRDVQSGHSAGIAYEVYAAGEVGKVAYDARLASDTGGKPSSMRVRAYRTDLSGGLLGPLHATHVEIGDVSGASTALVAQTSLGRGFTITNRPVTQADSFGRTNFQGELPRGWDAELYRNGQLLAFAESRSDGRYEFLDIALLYGQNRFEVVLYGPQGPTRRHVQIVAVGPDSIPPKKTYFWAGIDEAGHDLITLANPLLSDRGGWRGSVNVERGLDRKTSVAAMFHSLLLPYAGRHYFIENALRRSIGPALFEVSQSSDLTNGGQAWRVQALAQLGTTYISAESINASHGYQSDRVAQGVTGIQTLMIDQNVKLGRVFIPFHVETKYTTTLSGVDSLDVAARASVNIGRWLMTGELDWVKTAVHAGPSPPDQLNANLLANVRIGGVHIRGETHFEVAPVARLQSVSLVGEWLAGHDERRAAHWRAEVGYDETLSRARVGLGYVRQFKKVAMTASGEVASDGSVAGGLSLAFSLGDNGHGGARMTSEKLASHGAVSVHVYRDLNHNGIHDPGEPWEKGVLVTTGRVPVTDTTNADGEIIIDGLQPFIPLLVGIDASSLADPLMQPETVGLVITPRPGILQEIELAVATAGEVDATLVKPGGGRLEGVDLELVDLSDHVVAHTRTEYDGYALFEAVPYGSYTIRIAKLSAEALRLPAKLNVTAVVGAKSPSVHLGMIKVGL